MWSQRERTCSVESRIQAEVRHGRSGSRGTLVEASSVALQVIPSLVSLLYTQVCLLTIVFLSQFNATRDVADHPLQAANAYRSIVEALVLARQAAESADEAAETAYTRTYPGDLDVSLVERAKLSLEKSRELLFQSERMRTTVNQHKEQLRGESVMLEAVDSKLKKARTTNDETNSDMNKLLQGLFRNPLCNSQLEIHARILQFGIELKLQWRNLPMA